MKIKLSSVLMVSALALSGTLMGIGYNYISNANSETYLGLPVNRTMGTVLYDTSSIENAIKYNDYSFIAKVNYIKTTEYKYKNKLPYTIYNINVKENINGNLITSDSIELMQYGGINYDKKSYTFYEDEEYLKDGHYYFISAQTWSLVKGEGIILDKAIDLGETLESDEVELYLNKATNVKKLSYDKDSDYKQIMSKYDINYNK